MRGPEAENLLFIDLSALDSLCEQPQRKDTPKFSRPLNAFKGQACEG